MGCGLGPWCGSRGVVSRAALMVAQQAAAAGVRLMRHHTAHQLPGRSANGVRLQGGDLGSRLTSCRETFSPVQVGVWGRLQVQAGHASRSPSRTCLASLGWLCTTAFQANAQIDMHCIWTELLVNAQVGLVPAMRIQAHSALLLRRLLWCTARCGALSHPLKQVARCLDQHTYTSRCTAAFTLC